MELLLNFEEQALLADLPQGAIGDIKSEVRHTASSEYKDALRGREALMVDLMERLDALVRLNADGPRL